MAKVTKKTTQKAKSTTKKVAKNTEAEIKKAKTSSGYPIESALECLWEWRRQNGV